MFDTHWRWGTGPIDYSASGKPRMGMLPGMQEGSQPPKDACAIEREKRQNHHEFHCLTYFWAYPYPIGNSLTVTKSPFA